MNEIKKTCNLIFKNLFFSVSNDLRYFNEHQPEMGLGVTIKILQELKTEKNNLRSITVNKLILDSYHKCIKSFSFGYSDLILNDLKKKLRIHLDPVFFKFLSSDKKISDDELPEHFSLWNWARVNQFWRLDNIMYKIREIKLQDMRRLKLFEFPKKLQGIPKQNISNPLNDKEELVKSLKNQETRIAKVEHVTLSPQSTLTKVLVGLFAICLLANFVFFKTKDSGIP